MDRKRGDAILSTKRKMITPEVQLDGFWISCSIDTKCKIEDFFIKTYNYELKVTPIIINGTRPFSLYEFTKEPYDHTSMIIITKDGISKINNVCKNLNTEKEIYCMLLKLFNHYLKDKYSEELISITKILPLLAHHYFNHKDKKYNYDVENMHGRYLCMLYPMTRNISTGLNMVMNEIVVSKEDYILKDKIYFG